ncbi:MAG: phage/plasmid primase, P4 family [Ruminococcus sp.]|nr:phage/plasmid primase, P4 family [Ruminococcus sp.]
MYEQIPQELKALPNWICWDAVPDEKRGKIKKVPINALTGGGAMSNNPSTWCDFDTAVRASEKHSGIGFMFGGCPYFGVDIDGKEEELEAYQRGENGNIISEFISTLQSYTEISQSGKGIHIICRGKLPKRGRRKGSVEMYEDGRFFVMTGNSCSEYAGISDCTESIKPLHEKYIGGGREPQAKVRPAVSLSSADDIVKAAAGAKNGGKFVALYGGDTAGYTSSSEADMALCSILAFWTGCDASKMDVIFRSSGLMREKWDRPQSGSTYGALTIQKAIAGCSQVYSPKNSYSASFKQGEVNAQTEQTGQRLYSFDDTGNAQRFVDLFGDKVRYCYTDKRWLWYDGRKWCTDMTGAVKRLADKAVACMSAELKVYEQTDADEGTDMAKTFEKHMKSSRSNKSKNAMLNEVMHHVPILPSQLDRYKAALNTPGGVIDLKSGALAPHDPKNYFTKITAVEYSENADCPRWTAFLDDIFGGDKDLIRYVQKAVGYSLTGATSEQCAFFLYGTGRNGKSTFLDIIRDIFGDYAANIQPETIMVRSNQSTAINSDIARLKGARLVTSVEPNEGVRINEGLLKQLTGDDTVTARKLYGDEFEFKPEFKLWMATNHKPVIRGTDTGIWRRIHMIPFTCVIPEGKVDRRLKYKLAAEMTGIFRWAVEGCLLWQKEGLKMPRAVLEEVREYRREMDVISAFVEDKCTVGKGLSVKSSQLFAAYLNWAEQNNEYRMSSTKFGMELAKRFEKVKGRGCNYYSGITLDEQV